MSSKLSRLDFLRFSALGATSLILPSAAMAAAPKKAKATIRLLLIFIPRSLGIKIAKKGLIPAWLR